MSIFQKNKSLLSKKKTILKTFFPMIMMSLTLAFMLSISVFAQTDETSSETADETMDETADEMTDETMEEPAGGTGQELTIRKDIYHQHTGSSSGGGCYSVHRTGTKTVEVPCGGSMVYWPDLGTSSCSRCAASYFGDQSGRQCYHSTTQTQSYSYYDLGCGKGTGTCVGALIVKQSTTAWVKSLTLTASYENAGSMVVGEKPYIWNGADAVADAVYEVNESGIYTVRLNADACANTKAAVISVDIRNVDVTAPVITAHTQEPVSDWTKDGVVVTLTQMADLQADGTQGCGLHELPYSYDEGETWTDEVSHLYMENGTHTILIRDALENTSSYEVSFQNIDTTPPTIESIEYDHTKNIPSVEVNITASDLQPDGSEGCGLHETPYSFDGGKTWTAENTYVVKKNGILKIAVRDKLENIVLTEEKIENIDCSGPTLSYTMISRSWTNQDVNLYLAATDVNEDGTPGIGLADAWYSLDGGNTWSDQTHLVFEENTEFTILARDKNDNYSQTPIRINQIDRVQPWVSLSMQVIGEGRDMQVRLQASAEDDYSGIPEDAFSWDKGASYTEQSSITVTENGTYYVYARDKAGNSHFAGIEVDVFPELFPKLPLIPKKESQPKIQNVLETVEEEVTMEERIEQAEPETTQVLENKSIKTGSGLDRLILLFLVLFFLLMLMGILLWLYSRTIAVYTKDMEGKKHYLGRCWISNKEKYCVKIPQTMVDKAVRFQFLFCPSCFFAEEHKGEEIHFLFPEEVCITLTIERKMEMG